MVSMPSSCISLFRIKNQKLEFYGLGDCVRIIECIDGSIEVMIDHNIEKLDQIAINKMVEISKEKNISPIEACPFVREILIHHRRLRNTKEGYYSLDLTGEGIFNANVKTYDLSKVRRIACLSDGLYEVIAFLLYDDYTSLLNAMEINFEEVFNNLYNAQEDDFQAYKVPRFKKRDDATGIIAKISR